MNILLKLKSWQIFLIWIFGAIQMQIFMNTDFWYISMGIYLGLIFGWIYSIGRVLNRHIAKQIKKLNIWSIIYLVSMMPMVIRFHDFVSRSGERFHILILIVSGIIGFVSLINIGIISAKALKEKENGLKLKFTEYLLEFFLILYFIIGVWFIQPRLNKIIMMKK